MIMMMGWSQVLKSWPTQPGKSVLSVWCQDLDTRQRAKLGEHKSKSRQCLVSSNVFGNPRTKCKFPGKSLNSLVLFATSRVWWHRDCTSAQENTASSQPSMAPSHHGDWHSVPILAQGPKIEDCLMCLRSPPQKKNTRMIDSSNQLF